MKNRELMALRAINGDTQLELAQEIGISDWSYSKKEQGKVDFKINEIRGIAKRYNLGPMDVWRVFFAQQGNEVCKS